MPRVHKYVVFFVDYHRRHQEKRRTATLQPVLTQVKRHLASRNCSPTDGWRSDRLSAAPNFIGNIYRDQKPIQRQCIHIEIYDRLERGEGNVCAGVDDW